MTAHDEKLQRLHDGELAPAEAEALRAALTAEDREKLAALGEVDGLAGRALLAEAGELDLWSKLEERLPAAAPRRRTMARATAVITAFAMAAAYLLWLAPGPGQRQTNHADIESLEVAGGNATVIKIPGEAGDSTTLIWVDHKESDEWESLD